MSVETLHNPNLIEAEEEPDDFRPHDIGLANQVALLDAVSYEALGDDLYAHARALEQLHGLSDDVVSQYQQAGRSLVAAAADERVKWENNEVEHLDPILRIKIADCLAKQAMAVETPVYGGPDYQKGGRWERITREHLPDGTVEVYTHHQYLQKLTSEYLLEADTILKDAGVQSELAEEYSIANPAEVIPEAAVEAAQDIEAETQDYLPSFTSTGTRLPTVIHPRDINSTRQFIKANAKQAFVGAAVFSRMSEIALEELEHDSKEFRLN